VKHECERPRNSERLGTFDQHFPAAIVSIDTGFAGWRTTLSAFGAFSISNHSQRASPLDNEDNVGVLIDTLRGGMR